MSFIAYIVDSTSKDWFDWASQIIIPVICGVAIPIMIWYFSASRAEKKKGEVDLRNSLNFLLSISLSTLLDFLDIKKGFDERIQIVSNLRKNLDIILQTRNLSEQETSDFMLQSRVAFNLFPTIDPFSSVSPEKYSPVIHIDSNFVVDVVRAQRNIQMLFLQFENRNKEIDMLTPSVMNQSVGYVFQVYAFLMTEQNRLPHWNNQVCDIVVRLDKLIDNIHKIRESLPRLKLDNAIFSKEQQEQIDAIKKYAADMHARAKKQS